MDLKIYQAKDISKVIKSSPKLVRIDHWFFFFTQHALITQHADYAASDHFRISLPCLSACSITVSSLLFTWILKYHWVSRYVLLGILLQDRTVRHRVTPIKILITVNIKEIDYNVKKGCCSCPPPNLIEERRSKIEKTPLLIQRIQANCVTTRLSWLDWTFIWEQMSWQSLFDIMFLPYIQKLRKINLTQRSNFYNQITR